MVKQQRPSAPRDLVAEASALLSRYVRDGRTRTDILKQLADVIVDLRFSHTLADGRPDLSGRSAAYRADVHEIYHRARVPKADFDTVQTALRYHVNNRLHTASTPEELADVGISALSAKERLDARRNAYAALAASGTDPHDLPTLIVQAEALLGYVNADSISSVERKRARAARLSLTHILDVAAQLVAAIDAVYPVRRGGGAAKKVASKRV